MSIAISRTTIECTDPATSERLGEVPVTSPDEVRNAVGRAREAAQKWRNSSFAQRRRVLDHLLTHLLDHADELVDTVVRDSGKTRENALMGEIWPVAEKVRWTIGNGEAALRPERVSSGLFPHKKARIEFHPLGVIGIIAPWNYPLQNIPGRRFQRFLRAMGWWSRSRRPSPGRPVASRKSSISP